MFFNKVAKVKAFSNKKTLKLNGKLLDLSIPKVMGVLNVTPDSFYDGGRYIDTESVTSQAQKMVDENVDIIDIGGYSTRPGAIEVSEEEEKQRVCSAIETIKKAFPELPISVDTFRASVAKAAINTGASMINDVSGSSLDEKMFETVGDLNVPYVLMHMKGNPQTMTQLAQYDNMLFEIMDYFQKKVNILRSFGTTDIVIDVGFGFAKTIDQNYELLRNLSYFQALELPLLAGVSRKSMIYKTLKIKPEEALNGTTVVNTLAILNGANLLRVHDVKEAKETITIINKTFA
ncbi:MAG: dihydropteroate synthase [Bacteroidota bacterium]